MTFDTPLALAVVIHAGLGLVMGLGFFLALRLNVRLYRQGGLSAWAIAFHGGRLLLAALGFTLFAAQGAPALLAALAGFGIARLASLGRGDVS